MSLPFRIVLGLAIALPACDGDPPPAPDYSCDAMPDPHCAHPIDRILVPALRELGAGPRDADPDEVCRRMAIDLVGRGPTTAERATCRDVGFAAAAAAFQASPDYVRTQRRTWAELAKFESLGPWGADLADLDGLAAQLYRGELGYADFARRYVVHPGFYALHPADSWTANVFSIFLGRPARQDEIDAARPLLAPWVARTFAGGEVFWNHYVKIFNPADPINTEGPATAFGNQQAYNGGKAEWGVNLCRCTPGLLNPGCFSDVLGTFVRIDPICVVPDPADPANIHRLAARTPPTDGLCPDDLTVRPECAARGRGEAQTTFEPFYAWPELPAAGHAELAKIGDALVARADLWEAAADRELRKLLGWWQATFKHPDSDLPAVRALLAGMLRDGTTINEMIALIVTSQLYVQPSASPAGLDPAALPPWAAGPAKLLSGETWFATAASALGEVAGTCDFRWGQSSEYQPQWIDPRLVESTPGTLDALFPGAGPHGYSIRAIQRLGGCTGDARRPEISNIGLAFAQSGIARELCAVAGELTPPGWSGDLAAAATYLVDRVWHRAPIDGEIDELVAEMNACVAAGPTAGCADPTIAAGWLCQRMIDSAEYATY